MASDNSDLTTHPSLLLRVRDGANHQAWSEFVTIYGPLIYNYCRKRGLQESDAADISQEVLTRVASAIRNFDYQRERGKFRGWLGTITFRELSRYVKGQAQGIRLRPVAESVEDVATPASKSSDWDEHFHASLLQVALGRIEGEFEPETWQAFRGVWLDSESADHVAQRLGIGIEKVYVAKSRVLKRLRAEVLTLSEDAPLSG